jgi:hypothetical protein
MCSMVLKELNICTGYKLDGKVIDLLPIGADEVARCEPIYETMPGWSGTTFGVKRWEDLPANAQAYLNRLEVLCEVPIAIVSTGPERDETILKQHPFHVPHPARPDGRPGRRSAARNVLTAVGGYDWGICEFIRVTESVLPNRTFLRMCPELLNASRTEAGTPMRVQLLGSDPHFMAENARRVW